MGSVSSTITLVDQMSGALAGIESSINSMKNTLQSVAGEQTSIDKFNWDTFTQNAEKAGKKIEKIGQQMSLALTTPLIMLGKEMFGDATEYEAAFVGMQKTVDGTVEQYEHLNAVAKELSETTPSSYTELMGIAQTGGNLGVTIDNMETFLKSYSALQAATDQHIAGESGAQLVADFLNITDGGVQNIERFGSAIVDLGNHFNATEDQILGMGKRMAAAGTLAGLSTPEILGMAAAFRSVGINEEAGGSAASKFIKQMQLASEVGGNAQAKLDAVGQHFESSLDFSNWIDSSKKGDIADLAASLNMTTDAVRNMADSWVLMDQFAEVSGKTSEQFVKDWSKSPAQAMSDFFTGLSKLGDKGGESILATLDKMGLTEIRESNLIASMAAHPELFASAIETAVAAYAGNTAMWEEFEKQTGTQAAQNQMLGNKLHNTMANFGENLTKALEPALKMVNDILDAFNNLSETDQTNILKGLAVIAALGPALTIVGGAIKAIAAAMKLIAGNGKGAADAVQSVINAANGEGAASTAAETAGLSTGSKIVGGVTLAAVAYLFSKGIEYRNEHGALGSVEAIQKATQDDKVLRDAFIEWVAANNELNEAALRTDLSPDEAEAIVQRQQEAVEKFSALEGAGLVKDLYNDWRDLNGLSLEDYYLPEDFLNWVQSLETPEVEIPTPEVTVADDVLPEIEIPVIPEYKVEGDTDLLRSQFAEFGITDPIVVDSLISLGINPADLDISNLTNEVTRQLESTEEVSNAASNMGAAAITAANDAMSPENMVVGLGFGFGFGIASEIQETTPQVSQAATSMSAGAVNSAVSIFGNGAVPGASGAMAGEAVSAAEGILSSGAGSAIGRAFTSGLAAGISAGGGAAVAAAASVAAAIKAAISSVLKIHSPSRVAYWQGEMTMLGFTNGIKDGEANIIETVGTIFDNVKDTFNEQAWDLIGNFAGIEEKAWDDEMNNVEDKVKINDSTMKKIRSLAEREVINKFTTAEVRVEMNNTNNISNDMDIDGVIAALEDKVAERLEAVAEGVYN